MASSAKSSRNKKDSGNTSSSSAAKAEVGATASEAAEQVQDTVTGLKDQVKQQASTQLTSRLETATSGLDMAVKLLRSASDQVREQEKTGVADSINGVADRLENWSTTLRDQDVDKVVEEAKQLAQQKPALFIGGATALGFLGARFLTSSAKKQEDTSGSTSEGGSPADSASDSMSSSSADTGVDNTNPYPSTEENAALDASIAPPTGFDEMLIVDDTALEADVLLDDVVIEPDAMLDDTHLDGTPVDRSSSSRKAEDR